MQATQKKKTSEQKNLNSYSFILSPFRGLKNQVIERGSSHELKKLVLHPLANIKNFNGNYMQAVQKETSLGLKKSESLSIISPLPFKCFKMQAPQKENSPELRIRKPAAIFKCHTVRKIFFDASQVSIETD